VVAPVSLIPEAAVVVPEVAEVVEATTEAVEEPSLCGDRARALTVGPQEEFRDEKDDDLDEKLEWRPRASRDVPGPKSSSCFKRGRSEASINDCESFRPIVDSATTNVDAGAPQLW
jgi:hypothetical protein